MINDLIKRLKTCAVDDIYQLSAVEREAIINYFDKPKRKKKWRQSKACIAFNSHRLRAKRRNIGFSFSFQEWIEWWVSNLGPDWQSKRGTKRG